MKWGALMLRDAIEAVVATAQPDTIYDALTAQARERVGARSCALYVLDPSLGAYRLQSKVGQKPVPDLVPALPRRSNEEAAARLAGDLQRAVAGQPMNGTKTFVAGSDRSPIVGLLQDRTVYTFLFANDCQPPDSGAFADLAAIVKLAFVTLQDESSRRALQAQSHPIDITGTSVDFYREITYFLTQATGMQFIALRELHSPGDKDLRCTAIAGFESSNESDFNLVDFAVHEQFRLAVEQGEPTFSSNRSVKGLERLWAENPWSQDVQSFAVFPISDGTRTFAVLSVASSCRVDFTDTMKKIIGGVARFVGFTLRNRQLLYEKNDLQSSAIETATALNVVELFSDLTHQLRNGLGELQDAIEVARLRLLKSTREPGDITSYFQKIDDCFDRISDKLYQASDVTRIPDAELTKIDISRVWRNAVELVQYRLDKAHVTVKIRDDCSLDAYPVLLRQVFFHLLTNSLKAFEGRARVRGGEVSLFVNRDRATRSVTLRYVDNAGGINPAQLKNRRSKSGKAAPTGPVQETIFQRGVTGSRNGTGYGLWIARQILQRHQGGIELRKHREGVTFDIILPTNLRELSSRPKEM
jgi:signal transduction histidine kinase